MDRARLSASGGPHLSPRQAGVLQSGRSLGRCAARRMGSGGIVAAFESNAGASAPMSIYFVVGAGEGPAAAFVSINSTSKMSVEFGPISAPAPRSPYPRLAG